MSKELIKYKKDRIVFENECQCCKAILDEQVEIIMIKYKKDKPNGKSDTLLNR